MAKREAHPMLCCTGSFPGSFQIFITITFVFEWFVAVETSLALVKALRLLQFVSLCTAPAGIWLLRKEQKVKNVPRGCDCCCPCAYPPWSLLVQLLDVPFGLLGIVYEAHALGIIFFVINMLCVALDVAFSVLWLRALLAQDGDLCCGESKAGNATTPPVVVGRPVMIQDENVVTGVPAEEDLKAQAGMASTE
eukprot:TRINITY_DN20192_c0_g2_i1.p1 TRINITY_DN20192_c0_g2~~TRINITY_DN20192_c0_g2_i1.p1  ORF type:complete len:193 (+),score=24.85 TRINITY_DN20192_c0_g2_i1:70-648(+)